MPGKTIVPPRIVAKLRKICLALPGAYQEEAWAGTRWMVRKKNFAHVVQIDGGWPPAYARAAGSDGPLTVLTFRTSEMLDDALRTAGPPFFRAAWGTLWGTKVIGMTIDRGTDWKQVAMLIGESHRLLAPKKKTGPDGRPAPARLGERVRRRGRPRRADPSGRDPR